MAKLHIDLKFDVKEWWQRQELLIAEIFAEALNKSVEDVRVELGLSPVEYGVLESEVIQ
jgi:hypothetical protein